MKNKKASFPALELTLVIPKLSLGYFPSHLPPTTVVDYGEKEPHSGIISPVNLPSHLCLEIAALPVSQTGTSSH